MRCASLVRLGLFAVVAWSPIAGAQKASETSPAGGPAEEPFAIWGSLGLGQGNVSGASIAGLAAVFHANVSAGRWLLSYRDSDVGPMFGSGDGVRDGAVLVGMRTSNHRLFGSAMLGYGTASHYRRRGENASEPELVDPRVGVLAYDAAVHANYRIIGLALGLSGNAAPARVAYSAVTLGLELGWFDR